MAAPKNPLRSIFSSPKGVTWLLTGDSITHGAVYTFGWRSYPEHFMERLRWELRRMADTVVNTGTSGDTTDGLLRDLKGRVLRFRPDVTSIMMGMNDCVAGRAGIEAFRRNLLNLADASENNSSLLLLHTPNPIRPGADIERTHLPITRTLSARWLPGENSCWWTTTTIGSLKIGNTGRVPSLAGFRWHPSQRSGATSTCQALFR